MHDAAWVNARLATPADHRKGVVNMVITDLCVFEVGLK
jgi:hypothetical protein